MANTTIPNLPAAGSLDGTEQLEVVQNGTSKRVTADQIAALAENTQGTVTLINTGGALVGGPITTTGTISLPPDAVTNAYLAEMAANTLKANLTGLTANPTDVTPTELLDTFGTAEGSLLYRGPMVWNDLAPGSSGYYLTTTGNLPQWTALSVSPGDIVPTGVVAGSYGSASAVGTFTVNAGGQLTAASNVAISIPYTQVTGLGTMATQNANGVQITGGQMDGVSIGLTNPQSGAFTTLAVSGTSSLGIITSGTWNGGTISIAYGGTGATDAATARSNLGAAASGANSDITSLSGLTTALSAPQGGTGFASYTTGDLLYAATSNSLGRLNDVASGNVLLSAGVGVAPAYGKVGLTTHVSGTLPVANGGTGATTLTGFVKGNGTSAFTAVATIGNADLTNSTITIGSDVLALGASTTTLAGLDSVTLTQDPSAALQASTKQYVDNQVATVSNLTYHTQVTATTTGNLNATYSNGTGGVGATLTNAGALAQFQIDSYTPGSLARVLIKNQTNAYENGIYEVTTQGSGAVAWVLTRTSDFDTVGSGPTRIQTGASVFVQNGITFGSTSWVMTTTSPITVGSTNLNWTQTSSSGNILVNSPLSKSGNTISLGTVTVPFGGTGLTSYTIGDILYADTANSLAALADIATGNVLRSGGVGVAPAWGKVDLTTDITGTLPVANGGSGTSTAFTQGSVLFAGASGVYSQDNANFFWDDTNNYLSLGTTTPPARLTVVSPTQTALPSGSLPAGTDIYVVGANGAVTRITQDAFGTGSYNTYTGRMARGTSASPTATQSGDSLVQLGGRGYGATAFGTQSTGVIEFNAAENFTDAAQGTHISFFTTALGSTTRAEVFQIGPIGQLGVGGTSYGTANQILTSGGTNAAASWQSGINVTTLDASGAVNMTTATGNISIGGSQTSGTLSLGGAAQTGNVTLAPSTKTLSIGVGGGVTESGETKTLNLGTGGASGSTTAINIGASAFGSNSTMTLYGTVKVNGLTASKAVFSDASQNLTSSGTVGVDQGGTGQTTYIDGQLLIGNTTGNTLTKATLTAGSGVTITNGAGSITISATGSGGTVTSVDVSGGTTGLTTSGGPVTTSGTITIGGTLITSNGGTGLSSYTAGDLPYYAAGTALSKLGIGANGTILTSTGSAPQWTAGSSISVGIATNLAGGAAGSLPYQSGASTTTFLSIGAANTVMTSSGSAPQWVTSLTGLTGVSSSSLTNTSLTSGRVVYSTTGGAQTDSAGLTFDGTNFATTGTSSGAKFIPTGGTATGNGMYLATTNVVAFSTDGSERVRISATGFVGILQNNPGSALDVKGTLRLSGSTSGYVGLSPAAAAGSTTYTLPSADGTSGQFLSTNGSGTLSWAAAGGGAQDFIVQSYGIV